MTEPLTLTETTAIEVRDEATREVAIRLLPHDEVADRGTYTESIARGAHEGSDPERVIVRDAHRRDALTDIVGVGSSWEVREDATWLVARMAETPEGDRGLALARIGALRASAGFTEVEGGNHIEQRAGRRHVTRQHINVVEAGLLTNPSYHSTQVIAREEEPVVTEQVVTTAEAVEPPVTEPVQERADNRPVLAPTIIRSPRIVTAAQYAVLHVRASHGDAVARQHIVELRDRDAASRIEARILAEETTADVSAAAMPPTVVGDLVNRAIRYVPLFGLYRRLPLPELGMTFSRPKVTQHFDVDYQAAQKTELASRDVKFDADPVNIFTLGGALNVARQFIDRTPYWGRVFEDMVTTWANKVNVELGGAGDGTAAIKGLQSFATGLTVHATGATIDGGTLSTAVYTAWAELMGGDQKTGPDKAAMSALTWAKVASLTDAAKRPLFPSLAPANASGQASLDGPGGFYGLPVVVDEGIPEDFIYLVISDGLEFYSSPSGDQPFTLSVDEPGILGVETAIYSYIATYAKPDSMAVVKLGAATTRAARSSE